MRVPHAELSSWGDEQVDLLLAYQAYKAGIGPHGHPYSESANPGADPNDYKTPYAYVADGPFTDWAEKALKDAEQAWRDAHEKAPNMNGLFWTARRVDYS